MHLVLKYLEESQALVLEEYKEWEPDTFIVEKKSNGAALYQEMRRMGIPIGEYTPGKGQDKVSRVNAVSDLFRSGIVYAPDFLINAGGIINVFSEIAHYDKAESMRRTENIYNTTLEIFEYAKSNNLTPQKAAMEIADARIAQRKKEKAKL